MSKRLRTGYIITFSLLALLLGLVGLKRDRIAPLVPIEEGWEYSWRTDIDRPGSREWSTIEWEPIGYPSNPPGREGREAVWYRHRLPHLDIADPALFVYSIDLNAVFYVGDREIYRYMPTNPEDAPDFLGWPWHLIDIPPPAAGSYLTIRVSSNYSDIGLFGDILIGNKATQINRLYKRDLPRTLVIATSFIVGIIVLGIYLTVREEKATLYPAIISFLLVLRVLSHTFFRQYLLDAPIAWQLIRVGTSIAIPLMITLFLGTVFEGWMRRATRIGAVFFGILLVVSIIGLLSGLLRIFDVYPVADLGTVAVMAILAVFTVRSGISGNEEASLLTINFIIMGLFAVYSMLLFNGILPWSDAIDYLMVFQFSCGLVFVLIRRFLSIHMRLRTYAGELESMNGNLEKLVEERTRDLEAEKKMLRTISITDGLTGLYNRVHLMERYHAMVSEAQRYGKPLSIILFDIDHFKSVNDSHGHQTGDRALEIVARILQDSLRESDLCGRYGGEEFMLVLPETHSDRAMLVAERIRARVESLTGEGLPRLTVSGGIAQLNNESAHTLLKRADIRLYAAKDRGRNRIENGGTGAPSEQFEKPDAELELPATPDSAPGVPPDIRK